MSLRFTQAWMLASPSHQSLVSQPKHSRFAATATRYIYYRIAKCAARSSNIRDDDGKAASAIAVSCGHGYVIFDQVLRARQSDTCISFPVCLRSSVPRHSAGSTLRSLSLYVCVICHGYVTAPWPSQEQLSTFLTNSSPPQQQRDDNQSACPR